VVNKRTIVGLVIAGIAIAILVVGTMGVLGSQSTGATSASGNCPPGTSCTGVPFFPGPAALVGGLVGSLAVALLVFRRR
jgi:hypothetical protein